MIAKARIRLAFFGSTIAAITAAACGTIAELDVKYDSVSAAIDGGPIDASNVDGGGGPRIIRDSSFVEPDGEAPSLDPSDGGPCGPDSDDGGGCDFSQGLGCCLLPNQNSRCIFQWEIAAKCTNGIFIGCRGDDPNSESACCWRTEPTTNTKMTVLSVSCDGGAHACSNLEGGVGCATGTCAPNDCPIDGGSYEIGICGATKVACP